MASPLEIDSGASSRPFLGVLFVIRALTPFRGLSNMRAGGKTGGPSLWWRRAECNRDRTRPRFHTFILFIWSNRFPSKRLLDQLFCVKLVELPTPTAVVLLHSSVSEPSA